jgi:glycosyltransferase involved in cell wall biosynthesis
VNPLISIIIPTYKRPDKLYRAVKSVLAQTHTNIEIIVVDDNGNGRLQDSTTEVVESINDKRIMKIDHSENKGACAARNLGIKTASGDLLAFLDDDDEWTETFLEESLKVMKAENKCIVYSRCIIWDHEYKIKKLSNSICYTGKVKDYLLEGWCPPSTSLFLVKKECFDNVGEFDEGLVSFQDFDMWLRISNKYEFASTQQFLVIKNELEGEQISINPFTRQKGFDQFFEKWSNEFNGNNENRVKTLFLKEIYRNFVLKYYKNREFTRTIKYLIKYIVVNKKVDKRLLGTILFIILGEKNTLRFKRLLTNNLH